MHIFKALWTCFCKRLIGSSLPAVFAELELFWVNLGRLEFLEDPGIELLGHPSKGRFNRQTAHLFWNGTPPLPEEYELVPFAQAWASTPSRRSLLRQLRRLF